MMPALSAGLALVIIITIFWDICVIQFNPSVTVSLVMAEIIPLRLLLPNIIAQLSGATLAAYLASTLRGYPVGAIPIAADANWHIILGEFQITITFYYLVRSDRNRTHICNELCHRSGPVRCEVLALVDAVRDWHDRFPGCSGWMARWRRLHESGSCLWTGCCRWRVE